MKLSKKVKRLLREAVKAKCMEYDFIKGIQYQMDLLVSIPFGDLERRIRKQVR